MKLYIDPSPSTIGEDGVGSGGIARVVAAQGRWLFDYGIDVVNREQDADMVMLHAGNLIDTKKPIVAGCHGMYWSGDFAWNRDYWQYNISVIEVLRRACKIIVPSEWVAYPIKRDMRKVPAVIQHGVEFDEIMPQKQHQGYVLWGKPRTDVVCNPEIVNILAERARDIKFVTTFGRPTENVQVVGAMPYDDFQHVIDGAMIWLATARETGDIGSKEAMARGIPVLAWNHGGTAEFVKHKETGYLAELNNVDDLINGLYYCIENRQQLGEAARADIEANYQWRPIIGKYAKVLEEAWRGEQYPIDISIIVPTFNYAKYLDECFASIKSQTFKGKIEVIVVDDASTDNTQEFLSNLSWPEMQVVRHPENRGLSNALNTGHDRARGKYTINLDADNLLAPNALELLYDGMEAKPWVDVGSGSLMRYDKDGKHSLQIDWPFGRVDAQGQLNHINQVPSTSMMRRRSFAPLGGYRVRQRKNEDGEYWCRAISAGLRFERVTDKPVLIYRWHNDNKSKTEGGEDAPEGVLSWNYYYPWRNRHGIMPFASTVPSPKGSWAVRSYERPQISIIIPCGPGHQRYLPDALDSVIAQTYQNFECVIANDTGEPLDVAAMGHPWARVVDTGGHKGPAIARNTAIAAAKALLILPLDADDMLYVETVAKFYQAWLDFPDSIVYGDCDTEDSPGHRKLYHSGPWSYDRIMAWGVYQDVILFAKQWWEAVGGYPVDEPYGMWEDWIFGCFLHFAGIGATYIEEPWGVYRHWTSGASGQSKNDQDFAFAGTPEHKKRVSEVKSWLKNKEIEMACRGCGKKVASRTVGKNQKAVVTALSGEMTVVYDGPRAGSFTVNSQVYRQSKIRVERGVPFTVNRGDGWVSKLPGFHEVKIEEPKAAAFPAEPPVPPEVHFDVEIPPPVIAEAPKSDGLAVFEGIPHLKVDILKEAGFDSLDKVREDFTKNDGVNLGAIKGIGATTLQRIKERALG